MRRFLTALLLGGALSGAPLAVAAQPSTPFALLDEERLLRDSALGRAILAGIREAELELEAENQEVFDQLAAEEAELTAARAVLSPEEFRQRADAFDLRVEAIRAERGQRALELSRRSDEAARGFFETALPVLIQMMGEQGLVALLKPDALILGADWLDVTDAAIARLDAATGSDPAPLAPPALPSEAPTPDPAPGGDN